MLTWQGCWSVRFAPADVPVSAQSTYGVAAPGGGLCERPASPPYSALQTFTLPAEVPAAAPLHVTLLPLTSAAARAPASRLIVRAGNCAATTSGACVSYPTTTL